MNGQRVYFQAPEGVGRIHPQETRVGQHGHLRRRQPTVALRRIGGYPNQGFEVGDGGE